MGSERNPIVIPDGDEWADSNFLENLDVLQLINEMESGIFFLYPIDTVPFLQKKTSLCSQYLICVWF